MEKGEPQDDGHAACRALIAKLEENNKRLEREIEELKAQLNKNSRNSSKPPSSNPPWISNRPPKSPGERPPGGQPGHPGDSRTLLSPDQVSEVVGVKPKECRRCGRLLRGTDPDPRRHQVTDLPPVVAHTIEYLLHRLICPDCGTSTSAELPSGVSSGNFGPGVEALAAYLSGQAHLSKRLVQEVMKDCFGVEMSVGSVVAAQQAVSQALEEPVEQAREYVQSQPIVHSDETSWKEGSDQPDGTGRAKAWLWVAATRLVSVFLIHARRGADAARELLGEFSEYLVTDRWNGYHEWPIRKRQICWAHLIRDFRAYSEWKEGERIGKALLQESKKLFELWHRVRDGTLSQGTFGRKVGPIRQRVEKLLHRATRSENGELARSCARMLKVFPAFWTFVRVPGMEPTNNAAERALRPGVLYRKISFGTQSDRGSRFVERMLTVVCTLRLQGRNVLDYLRKACERANLGREAPSLLPAARLARAVS
jgi:transposase